MTTSPSWPGSSAGNDRTSVGRSFRLNCRFNAWIRRSGTSATVTAPRARGGATASSQRASPGARTFGGVTTSTTRRWRLGIGIPGARTRIGVVRLDDLLHQLVPHHVLLVEEDDADAFDVLDHLQRF